MKLNIANSNAEPNKEESTEDEEESKKEEAEKTEEEKKAEQKENLMKAVFEDEEEDNKEKKEEKPSAAAQAETDDNVELESEDVNEADEGTTSAKPEESKPAQTTKLGANEEAKEPEVKRPKLDFSLMDHLTSFLYQPEDPLPILCGYFNKIMQQLLVKQKNNTLDYMLVEQNGKIFHGLLNHLQHHSLALLLISLLEIQI